MKYRKFALTMILMTCLNAIASLAAPIMVSSWSQPNQSIDLLKVTILLTVLIFTLVFNIIITYFREKFAVNYNVQRGKNLFEKMFHMKYDSIGEAGPTSIVEKIVIAVNSAYRYYTIDAINIWSNLLILLILLIMTFSKSKVIGILLFALVPINYFGYKWLNRELLVRSREMQKKTSQGMQNLISIAGQTDYLKQSSDYNHVLAQISSPLKEMYLATSGVNKFGQMLNQVFTNINDIGRILIMILVVYDYTSSTSNEGNLIFFTVVLPIYFSGLSKIVSANLSKRDLVASNEFIAWMDGEREEDGATELSTVEDITWNIKELRMGEKVLAQNLNAAFQKGDIVWVKGKSGSGKSTLLKLLPKFRVTDSISINGIDIREYSNTSLRRHVDHLSQNVPMIQGTLLENLFFNRKQDIEVEKEMLSDPLLETILVSKQPETEIYENGSNLSGGEKQKIAFVRAIYSRAEILILDEITSNIDAQSSADIYSRVKDVRQDKIIFIITHDDNLGDMDIANRIIDLEEIL